MTATTIAPDTTEHIDVPDRPEVAHAFYHDELTTDAAAVTTLCGIVTTPDLLVDAPPRQTIMCIACQEAGA